MKIVLAMKARQCKILWTRQPWATNEFTEPVIWHAKCKVQTFFSDASVQNFVTLESMCHRIKPEGCAHIAAKTHFCKVFQIFHMRTISSNFIKSRYLCQAANEAHMQHLHNKHKAAADSAAGNVMRSVSVHASRGILAAHTSLANELEILFFCTTNSDVKLS